MHSIRVDLQKRRETSGVLHAEVHERADEIHGHLRAIQAFSKGTGRRVQQEHQRHNALSLHEVVLPSIIEEDKLPPLVPSSNNYIK